MVIGEKIGEPKLETPGRFDEFVTTLPPSTTSQLNPTSRKWKQFARQAHVGDSSMQNTVARERCGDECGWGQPEEPCKKIQLFKETSPSNSMVKATRQPHQDQ